MIERINYFEIIFIIFLAFDFGNIYCINFKNPIAHPIQIDFDFSNFIKNDNSEILIKLLKRVKGIISRLIYCNNNRKLTIDNKLISKCYRKISFINTNNLTIDLVIFPKFRYSQTNNFEVYICQEFFFMKVQPAIAILYINRDINLKNIINNKYSKYIFLMEMVRAFTDCLGLTEQFMSAIRMPKNNFFETPLYFFKYSRSFKSINKLYNLLGKKFQSKSYDVYGNFYFPYWDENSIIKDIRSYKIEIDNDISEVSMNLLNDMDFYKTSQCDFYSLPKKGCYRVDQKCLSLKEYNLFYLNYAINFEKEDEIICYLSDSYNLKNKQCGILYGHLFEESIDFCPLVKKYNSIIPKYKKYEIPELQYYKSQTLNLLEPSKKCKRPTPRTIYFKSDVREKEPKNIIINTITLDENQRKFFVTYLTEEEIYYSYYVDLLNNNGLIRSFAINDYHNILIKYFRNTFSLQKNVKKKYINKYQKIVQILGNEQIYLKDLLYSNYLKMRKHFPEDYNYMPKTYIYPKDKEKIEIKFKNYKFNLKKLWIVKPNNLSFGQGIHFLISLKEEAFNKYLISEYLKNPHLIYGRKYDFRLYILVTGLKPLRIYLNKEGLIRIATNNYSLSLESIKDNFTHLTNTGINVRNKKYHYAENSSDELANKWNFATYKKYLKKHKISSKSIFAKIKDLIIKTIISGINPIIDLESRINLDDRSMFNIFGFDVLIDKELNPTLLEVNSRPSMKIYDSMDKIIKTNLLVDSLNIVGIVPFSHERRFKSFDLDYIYKKKVNARVNNAYCELTRPRGDFELIFPLKSNINKYKKYFLEGESSENKIFWKKILEPKKTKK